MDGISRIWHWRMFCRYHTPLPIAILFSYPCAATWNRSFIAACIGLSMFEQTDSVVQPTPAPEVRVTMTGILSIRVCKRSHRELLSPINFFVPNELPSDQLRQIGADSFAKALLHKRGNVGESMWYLKENSREDFELRFRKNSKNPDGNITHYVKLFCMLFEIFIVCCKWGKSNDYLHNIEVICRDRYDQ